MRFVALFMFFTIVTGACVPLKAQVRINEILADPVSDWNGDGEVSSKTDEWLEVINIGVTTINMDSFRIGDESGGFTWRYGFSGDLPPGEMIVVYGSDATAWQSEHGFPSYGLSLNNGGDTVYLYRVSATDTIVVDRYTYESFTVLDDRSVGRYPAGTDTWSIFDGLNPYSGKNPPLGTGCPPSPGAASGCSTPAEETTWGGIKSKFSG